MKVKIKKLESGGFTSATYYVDQMPTPVTPSGAAAAGSDKASASSILDDETYKELLTKGGLVNDVNSLVSEIIQLETRNTNPFIASNNRSTAIKLIGRVNELKENKALWKESMDNAKEAGGLSEIAVGTSGEVYIKGQDNKVKAIGLDEYKERKDEVQLLSVAELLKHRNYDPNETGNNELFNVANNSIGLAKINDTIRTMISSLGKESSDSTSFQTKD